MSASQGGARRTHRAWIIAGLIAVAGTLAGCSGSGAGDSAAEYDAADSGGYYDEEAAADIDTGSRVMGEDATTTSTADRALIVTGEMYMTVDDPVAAADEATRIVESAGGRVDSRRETAPDEYYGGDAWLTLRVPADRLDDVLDDMRGLGVVDRLSTQSSDVTQTVTDLDARISTLRASTERIEGLLTQAEKIEDIITLEEELSSRQAQLESLEAQQRGLDDQVSMSTMELSLTTEAVVTVDDDPDTFWDGLVAGWNGLITFMSGALVVLGVLLPWLAVAGVVTVVVVLVLRSRRSRRSRAAGPAQPDAASASDTSSSVV